MYHSLLSDAADANCASCCSWEPEKELMVSKMMTSQQVVDQLKSERDQLEYQLNQLQHPRLLTLSLYPH